jgi:hypothetical protein
MGTQSVLDGAGGAVVVSEDEVQSASAVEMVLKSRDLQLSLGSKAQHFVKPVAPSLAAGPERRLCHFQLMTGSSIADACPAVRQIRCVALM